MRVASIWWTAGVPDHGTHPPERVLFGRCKYSIRTATRASFFRAGTIVFALWTRVESSAVERLSANRSNLRNAQRFADHERAGNGKHEHEWMEHGRTQLHAAEPERGPDAALPRRIANHRDQ